MGLWETLPVVTAIVWALTTGFSLLLHLGELLEGDNAFRSRVFRILGPSTVVAEIVGVSVLAFWWELLLIPILFVLVIAVYANRSTVLTIVSSALLMAYAVGLISGVIIDLVNDPGTWRSVTQAILLPIALTVGTLPYIQLLVLVERFRFSRGAKCKMVTSSEYGKDWPLIVDSARLCCRFRAVWVEVNGKKYGVNGTAMSLLKKYGYACPDPKPGRLQREDQPGALLSDWQLSTKCKGDCEIMGSRKIIKQVQVPAETTGNLYTLTEYDDGTIGCTCSSGVRQGPLLGTSDKLCEHLISFRWSQTAINIPELFVVGGVVIEDFLDEDIDEFVMTPDKYTPRAIGAFIIALAKVFSETSLPLQQQVTASSLLADLERQLESSIQNLPMLTLEEEKAARWLRSFLYHTVQSYQSLWGQEDPE